MRFAPFFICVKNVLIHLLSDKNVELSCKTVFEKKLTEF